MFNSLSVVMSPHTAIGSVEDAVGQVYAALLTKPACVGRLKSDQPLSQLLVPNAPLKSVCVYQLSGTVSTFEYATEPHAGRGSIAVVLSSVNVPPAISGSAETEDHGVEGLLQPFAVSKVKAELAPSMMAFDEK